MASLLKMLHGRVPPSTSAYSRDSNHRIISAYESLTHRPRIIQPVSTRSRGSSEKGDRVEHTEHGSLMRSDYGRRTVSAPSNAF